MKLLNFEIKKLKKKKPIRNKKKKIKKVKKEKFNWNEFVTGVLNLIKVSLLLLIMFISISIYNEVSNNDFEQVIDDNSTNYYSVVSKNIQGSHLQIPKNYNPTSKTYCVYGVDYVSQPYGSSMQTTFFMGNEVLMKDVHDCELDPVNKVINCLDTANNYMVIEPGDIVRFINPSIRGDKYIIHRIASLYPNHAYIEADHYRNADNVPYQNIIGVAIGTVYT